MHSTSWSFLSLLCLCQLACLAGCHFGSGSELTAERDHESHLLSDQQVSDVQLSLARSLEIQGEIEPAMNAYQKAIQKAPKRSTAYWRLAVLHDRQGRLHESGSLYKQALVLDRKNSDIHCDYGYSLYLQRRWAEAEEQFKLALASKSTNRRARNNLGLLLTQTERFDEALIEFRRGGEGEVDAHVNLAFALMLRKDWDRAREEYQLALASNPNSAAARAGIEKLEVLVAKSKGEHDRIALAAGEEDVPASSSKNVVPAAYDSTGHARVKRAN